MSACFEHFPIAFATFASNNYVLFLQVSTGLMAIATQKELQELNISLLLNPNSWTEGMNEEADFDVLNLNEYELRSLKNPRKFSPQLSHFQRPGKSSCLELLGDPDPRRPDSGQSRDCGQRLQLDLDPQLPERPSTPAIWTRGPGEQFLVQRGNCGE